MKNLTLKVNEIHVWHASIVIEREMESTCLSVLSQDEKVRADRFHFKKDRNVYIAARFILRFLLSQYLNRNPDALRFSYSAHGKPFLKTRSSAEPKLEFNLSHSGEKALFAFCLDRPLGIDLERLRKNTDILSLAKRFFSPGEYSDLISLPDKERLGAFFLCWVRKEAFIKAKERGLSLGLSKFEVSLNPDKPAVLKHTFYQKKDAENWSLFNIKVEKDYRAALAVKGKNVEVRSFHWRWDNT